MLETNTTQRIAQYVAALPEKQLKAAMLTWLTHDDVSIEDLAETLAQEQADIHDIDALYDRPEAKKLFPTMTEEEMVEASLTALEEDERTGGGYSHTEAKAWFSTIQANV